MKKFDILGFVGRVLIGFYFIIHGFSIFNTITYPLFPLPMVIFSGITSLLGIIGGICLISGVKPRAVAAVLALFLVISIWIDLAWFYSSESNYQHHIYESFLSSSGLRDGRGEIITHWASQQVHLLLAKMCVLGSCLFIIGARKIPYTVFARSESNLINKYGKKDEVMAAQKNKATVEG